MSIRQLQALVAINKHGSFARAAEQLNLTQSAISMQILKLERQYKAPLFDRTSRPPTLTPAGKDMLERARTALHHYQQVFDTERHEKKQTSLRFGIVTTALIPMLPKILLILRDQASDIMFHVDSGLSGNLRDMVSNSEIDAALISKPNKVQPWLQWTPVVQQNVVVIAPPNSQEESLTELFNKYPYIRFNRHAWIAPAIEQRIQQLQLQPQTKSEITSIEAIYMMVSAGFGISVIPTFSNWQTPPSFRVLELGKPHLYRSLGLLSHKKSSDQPVIDRLYKVMKLAAKL